MATKIDSHSRDLKLGTTLIRIRMKAIVSLVELADRTFEFRVDYSYTGTFGNRGHICVPVNGNCDEERELGKGLTMGYTVSNWTLTDERVSCDLEVWGQYKRSNTKETSAIQTQHFSGLRPVPSPATS